MLTSLLAGFAVLLLVLSIPLAAQMVPPNRLYGFRTPRTRADERVWYPTNKITGRNGIVMAMALALTAGLSAVGLAGFWTLLGLGVFAVAGLISTVVSASNIVNQVDQGGPLIDYSSQFDKKERSSPTKEREKLLKKLRKQ